MDTTQTPTQAQVPKQPDLSAAFELHTQALAKIRLASLAVLFSLILLCFLWEWWLLPTGNRTMTLKALPLCFAVWGIVRHRMYTFRWLSLLLWLYVLEGGVRIYSSSSMEVALSSAEIVLSIMLFLLCARHIRLRLGFKQNNPHLLSPGTSP